MSLPEHTPPVHRTLIELLGSALNRRAETIDLSSDAWRDVLRLARRHGVDTFLYPWLAERVPSLFAFRAAVDADSAPAAWRALFFKALADAPQRQRQVREIAAAFSADHLDVVPLKGVWLGETVYADPAQRSMSDIDMLVRESDRDRCHQAMARLGYAHTHGALHSAFAYDQTYSHPGYPYPLEMHWQFTSELTPDDPVPAIDDVWNRALAATFLGVPIRQLSNEDLLCQLVQHVLHHRFAVPLRSYVDLALLLVQFGDAFTPSALDAAARSWKLGDALPFVAGFVAELFNLPLTGAIRDYTQRGPTHLYPQAFETVFHVPEPHARRGEETLLKFSNASAGQRVRIVLARIFMPRAFLVLRYPCARRSLGLPLAWLLRARDLVRNNRQRIAAVRRLHSADAETLAFTEKRLTLTAALLRSAQKNPTDERSAGSK
jgi:hypothetical protein